jgi:hypothetical protein
LNEDAESVFINIYKDGESVASGDLGALTKGVKIIDNPFTVTDIDAWSITATARAVNRPVRLTGDESPFLFNSIRGVAIDNNPESLFFGRVYVSEGQAGTAGRTTQDGIYILNAALQDVTAQGSNAYAGDVAWGSTTASPFRLAVAPDGKVYITDWSDGATAGVWMMNPANPAGAFRPVFGGTISSTGLATENGVEIHGSISHCWVTGSGANTRLFTFDEDLLVPGRTPDGAYIRGGNLLQYNIGAATLPWTAAPSAVPYDDVVNGNLQKNGNSVIAPDGIGGWWISQYRAATGDAATPTIIHVAVSGTVDYNVGSTLTSCYQGAMAVSNDGKLLAMAAATGVVEIYNITYGQNQAPALSLAYTIEHALGSTFSIAFDLAGNLYVTGGNTRLLVYALPKAENSFTTRVPYNRATGIRLPELSLNDRVSVYPNPVVSDITIDANGLNLQGYTLYDVKGQMVRSGKLNLLQTSIPVAGLNAGVYVLHLKTDEGLLAKRIIKK